MSMPCQIQLRSIAMPLLVPDTDTSTHGLHSNNMLPRYNTIHYQLPIPTSMHAALMHSCTPISLAKHQFTIQWNARSIFQTASSTSPVLKAQIGFLLRARGLLKHH